MDIERPYFCDSELKGRTDNFPTMEEAVRAACEQHLAPFVIYKIMAQPIGQRLSNMDMPQVTNGVHQ
jgi:hypothetical protein